MSHKANISWLNDQLATGGDFAMLDEVMEEQLADLIEQEVDLVIDCRLDEEGDDTELWQVVRKITGGKPEYVRLPTEDREGHVLDDAHFYAAQAAAAPVIEAGGKVLIHCHMGVNRGPSTAMYVLMRQFDMSPQDAFDLIREKRPQAGVYYAEDAVRAWVWNTPSRTKSAIRQFTSHRDQVFGPEEQAKIEHVMREGHASDRRQMSEGRL